MRSRLASAFRMNTLPVKLNWANWSDPGAGCAISIERPHPAMGGARTFS